MNTDLQLGYEIYDKSYEINAVVQGIVTAATLSNVIQSDDATRAALNSLSAVANQLRRSVSPFITQIANAAASRSNNEAWHLTAIRNAFVTHNAALTVLLNTTGPLSGLIDVTNPSLVSAIRAALTRVQLSSDSVLVSAEAITRDVAGVRANSSLLLTPMLLSDFIDTETSEEIISSLDSVRNSLIVLSSAIRDAGRLVVAHGSIHELLSRPSSRDTTTRSIALNNFVNNYNRVINNLVSSIASYRQAAETGIYKFINRVQSTFDDSIVRPKFDKAQLPLIRAFSSVISSKVYNRTFFRTSFDTMRDSIVDSYVNGTGSVISQGSEHRDVILYLLRTSFVRQYSSCLDELVTEVQLNSNSITNKFAFCLNERTSGIVVVIPSTITWLSVIRDNINFILQRLNGCLNGQTSVAGRTAISDCIQIVCRFNFLHLVELSYQFLIVFSSSSLRTQTISFSIQLICRLRLNQICDQLSKAHQ